MGEQGSGKSFVGSILERALQQFGYDKQEYSDSDIIIYNLKKELNAPAKTIIIKETQIHKINTTEVEI